MNLKQLRIKNGLLAKKIAADLGISYQDYHLIEIGQLGLNKLKVEKLAYLHRIPREKIIKAWEEENENYKKRVGNRQASCSKVGQVKKEEPNNKREMKY